MTQELRFTACVRSDKAEDCSRDGKGWTATVRVDQLNLDQIGSCELEQPETLGNCYVDGEQVTGYSATGLTRRGCREQCQHCLDRQPATGATEATGDAAPQAQGAPCAVLWQPRAAGAAGVRCSGAEACGCLTVTEQ